MVAVAVLPFRLRSMVVTVLMPETASLLSTSMRARVREVARSWSASLAMAAFRAGHGRLPHGVLVVGGDQDAPVLALDLPESGDDLAYRCGGLG